MAEQNPMMAVGDTITTKLPQGESGKITAGIVYQSGAVGFSGALEVSIDGVNFSLAKFHDPAVGELGAEASAFTTDKQIGWIRNPGYTYVRLRCTAFTTPGNGVMGRINPVDE